LLKIDERIDEKIDENFLIINLRENIDEKLILPTHTNLANGNVHCRNWGLEIPGT